MAGNRIVVKWPRGASPQNLEEADFAGAVIEALEHGLVLRGAYGEALPNTA